MRGLRRSGPLLLTLALGCDAGEKPPAPPHFDPTEEARRAVEVARDEALRAETLDSLGRDLDQFGRDVSATAQMIAEATTQADREAGRSHLEALRQEQSKLKARIARARMAMEKARRHDRMTDRP
jgi:hypothetical protein